MIPLHNGFSLFQGYRPGLIGAVSSLFAQHFSDAYDFGAYFECKVAKEIVAFIENYDPENSCIWSIEKDGQIYGSITLDGSHAQKDGAHVRWFILNPKTRGFGLGQTLINEMLSFARKKNFDSLYLYTLAGLEPAGSLYRRLGFEVEEEFEGDQWGSKVLEQKLRLEIG